MHVRVLCLCLCRARSPRGFLAVGQLRCPEIIRALDGPLAEVRGQRPEAATYAGAAAHLQEVWVAVRASLRQVLEHVTLADIASGKLPRHVERMTADPDAWRPH